MTLSRPFMAATLREEGVVFFEFNPSVTDPDVVVVVECYQTHEAHELHWTTPHFVAMWKDVERLALEVRFENILSDWVTSDAVKFGRTAI